MNSTARLIPLVAGTLVSTACANLAPSYERPISPIPNDVTADVENHLADVSQLKWQDVILDEKLKDLIELALSENRDLRIAAGNIELMRARYGIQTSERFPNFSASASATEGDTLNETAASRSSFGDSASASIGLSSYELDFFSRVRNLSDAALQQWLATVEGKRSSEISIVSSIVQMWIQLAADVELLDLAENTVRVQSESLDLTRELFDAGVATEIDTRRASTSVETARAEAARLKAKIRQDLNALRFIVGTDIPSDIAKTAKLTPSPILLAAPENLNSDILLNRPDVLQAELNLKAQNANIGAARAAFYPNISITGALGVVSADFNSLFDDAGSGWRVTPTFNLPIFDGGLRKNNLEAAKASRDIAIAQYERAVQQAFRDTADALANAESFDERIAALSQLNEDTSITLDLSTKRFRAGVDGYLSVLDAQQTDFNSSQQLIAARRDYALNQVALFQALGAQISE